MTRSMSQQLTFSATVCVLTLALFAISSGPAFQSRGASMDAQPFAVSGFVQR